VNCPLCHAEKIGRRFRLDSDFELHRCAACGYQFVLRRPSIDELTAVYEPPPPGTFGEHTQEATRELGLIYNDLISSSGCTGKRVLEVGCNTGFILKGLSDLGYSVTGTDLSSTAVRFAREWYGLDSIYLAEFPPATETGAFDVLIASHVIEHVLEPRDFVDKCARFLRKDGIFIIRTPNVDSIGIRAFRGYYPVFCPPIHLNHFSVRTLSSVLDPHFSVIRSVTHGEWSDPRNTVFNCLVAVSHILGVKKKLKATVVLQNPGPNGYQRSSALSAARLASQITERVLSPAFVVAGWMGAGENILLIATKK